MKKWTLFSKALSGRNMTKDIITLVVLIIIYVALLTIMVTPLGDQILSFVLPDMPFVKLVQNALMDFENAFEWMFDLFYAEKAAQTHQAETQALGVLMIPMDLSKLLLAAMVQNFLFWMCSLLLLYGRKSRSAISDLLMGMGDSGKKDILYAVNSGLLMGLTFLIGALVSNFTVALISEKLLVGTTLIRFLRAMGIFGVVFVVYSLFFSIMSATTGRGISFWQSLKRSATEKVCQGIFNAFFTNLLMILLMFTTSVYGFHPFSLIIVLMMILLRALLAVASSLLEKSLVRALPSVGRTCPITGTIGVFATLGIFLCYCFMTIPIMEETGIMEQFTCNVPFLRLWYYGGSPISLLVGAFEANLYPLLELFAVCHLLVVVQHLTSTYKWTLPSQVLLRSLLLGIGLVIIMTSHVIINQFLTPLVANSPYEELILVTMLLGYLVFAIFQPRWALWGTLTTLGMLLMLEWVPAAPYTEFGVSYDGLIRFVFTTLFIVAVELLLALVHNILTVIERGKSALTSTLSKAETVKDVCDALSDYKDVVEAVANPAEQAKEIAVAIPTAVAAAQIGVTIGEEIVERSEQKKEQKRQFCGKCGCELVPGSRFCDQCGKPTGVETESTGDHS